VDLEDFGFVEDILEARAGFGCNLYEFLENSLCTVEVACARFVSTHAFRVVGRPGNHRAMSYRYIITGVDTNS
jgi:hypothetical protein